MPLYAVETVRMLADRGILEPRTDAFELVGDIGDLEIPGTLQALIAARLDSLGPEDRVLLQDASVLGKSFPVEALAAITGQRPRDARAAACATWSRRSSWSKRAIRGRPSADSTRSSRA